MIKGEAYEIYLLSMKVLIAMPTTAHRPPVRKNNTNIGQMETVEMIPFSVAVSIGINSSADIPQDNRLPKRIAPPPEKKHTTMRLQR